MALRAGVGAPGVPALLRGPAGLPASADYTPTRMKVSKSCVPSCSEIMYDGYSKHESTTSCCQYYLCNNAGLAPLMTLDLAPKLLAIL